MSDDASVTPETPGPWSADTALTVLLWALGISVFVEPIFGGKIVGSRPFDLTMTLVMLAAVLSVGGHWWARVVGYALALTTVVSLWASRTAELERLYSLHALSGLLLLCAVLAVVMKGVMAPGRITRHRVRGAIVGYLLLALVFTMAYALLLIADPGAFSFPNAWEDLGSPAAAAKARLKDLEYFSFVTLTTLGFGDITPATRAARHLAALEAVIGQLYVAILIARLVSLEVSHRRN